MTAKTEVEKTLSFVPQWTMETISTKDFIEACQNKLIRFDLAIQRIIPAGWLKPESISALMDSMSKGVYIQPIHMVDNLDGTRSCLDGQCRANAINSTAAGLVTIAGCDNDGINSLFSMWTPEDRERFYAYPLTLIVYPATVTEEYKANAFTKLNKMGKPLSSQEAKRGQYLPRLQRAKLESLAIDGLKPREIEKIIVYTAELMTQDNPSFDPQVYDRFNNVNQSTLDIIKERIIKLNEAFDAGQDDPACKISKVCKTVHIVSILATMPAKIKTDDLWTRLAAFFGPTAKNRSGRREDYDKLSQANTAATSTIIDRKAIMEDVLNGKSTPAKPLPTTEEKRQKDLETMNKERQEQESETPTQEDPVSTETETANNPQPETTTQTSKFKQRQEKQKSKNGKK